ncbi:MAG: hypothetical protein CMP48_09905 [Rickettsiales bacterium]|nr:hypothetical protein [Rickettsiales bacterium]
MDDARIWIYIVAGAIYLISRALKKKKPDAVPRKPTGSRPSAPSSSPNKPVSFEELLREFTEGKAADPEPTPEPVETRRAVEERKWQQENKTVEDFSNEGRNRTFADDESRRVYEESIKNAEGAEINFERDEHFRIKLKDRKEEESDRSGFATEISEMLRNPEDARKAVILGEILNRKY